jgi:hypothetical protein
MNNKQKQTNTVPLTDEQKQQIHDATGAGHALICLVESYINGITAQPAACGWSQDGDSYSDTWATSCGHYFRLDDGTPTDNKMAFCCYCGKSLVSYPFVEDEDE